MHHFVQANEHKLMIRDVTLKMLLIPLLGLLLPFITGVVVFTAHNNTYLPATLVFFILVTYIIWQLTVYISHFIRHSRPALKSVYYKLGMLVFAVGLIIAFIAGVFLLIWQKLFIGSYQKNTLISASLTYSGTAVLIGLVYEILFLQKEAELESKIVNQLDLERQYAEMHVLKNELDPHFIFNSLTALSHLINEDSQKALLFNSKLAQVYKYLLLNKDKDLITLQEELRFIKDYFFLLQIRYGEMLKLEIHITNEQASIIKILPCALQLLVENAIKHNSFSNGQSLQVLIYLAKNQLHVANNVTGKNGRATSTHIGLKNLSNRYRLICRKNIVVSKTETNFLVKLPLIKPTEV